MEALRGRRVALMPSGREDSAVAGESQWVWMLQTLPSDRSLEALRWWLLNAQVWSQVDAGT
ncbi:hypothetical protein D9619_013687 [Psilocybe cf. subviscida]|uniref:Uncharacterized protein n=1 Tax=Psilocybe cf. subviscida TaxID=2480587 RepID=A0A8H5EVC3_9AGAR|nr:hypothetical protein D9619_013687 [Psilocybe cf. subviscida]